MQEQQASQDGSTGRRKWLETDCALPCLWWCSCLLSATALWWWVSKGQQRGKNCGLLFLLSSPLPIQRRRPSGFRRGEPQVTGEARRRPSLSAGWSGRAQQQYRCRIGSVDLVTGRGHLALSGCRRQRDPIVAAGTGGSRRNRNRSRTGLLVRATTSQHTSTSRRVSRTHNSHRFAPPGRRVS